MNKLALLEGLLFVVGDEGLTVDKISEILEINKEESINLLNELIDRYEQDIYGVRIEYLGNVYKLVTKKEHQDIYKRLLNEKTTTLSQSALETLAIIAYNEPITRYNINEIRGIDSYHMVRKLLNINFIKEVGKADTIGRPALYGITNKFLDYFGLSSKDDLPTLKKTDDKNNEEIDLFQSKYKENID